MLIFCLLFLQSDPLEELSLEDLLQVSIDAATRTSQKWIESPSASHILRKSDIQASGYTQLPDVLRLIPGVMVSRIDSSKWSISIRAFGGRFSNKLLVLIDNRVVFTPLFSGVYWDMQDVDVDEIELIETIRGPGGSLWGTNSVNGLIHIKTKSAQRSTGTRLSLAGGNAELKAKASVRRGFWTKLGWFKVDGGFRSYHPGLVPQNDQKVVPSDLSLLIGNSAHDSGETYRLGLQFVSDPSKKHKVYGQFQAQKGQWNQTRILSGFESNQAIPDVLDSHSEIVQFAVESPGSWYETRKIQLFYDQYRREDGALLEHRKRGQAMLSFSGHTPKLKWTFGAELMLSEDETQSKSVIALLPPSQRTNYQAIFTHWSRELVKDLKLDAGARFENRTDLDVTFLPNIRLSKIRNHQILWASWSKAGRAPARADKDLVIQFGSDVIPIGNPELESEFLEASEMGMRYLFHNGILLDFSLFYHHYEDLITGNLNQGRQSTNGGEVFVDWKPNSQFSLSSSLSYIDFKKSNSTFQDAPDWFGFVRTNYKKKNWQFWSSFYYRSKTKNIRVPQMERWDFNFNYRFDSRWNLALTVLNATDDISNEAIEATRLSSVIERSFILYAKFKTQ